MDSLPPKELPLAADETPAAHDAELRHENNTNDIDRPLAERGTSAPYIGDVVEQRYGRRGFLQGSAIAAATIAAPNLLIADSAEARGRGARGGETLGFTPIEPTSADTVVVPDGYTADVVLRWGDSLNPAIASLDTTKLIALDPNAPVEDCVTLPQESALVQPGAAEAQANQFGVAADAAHFFPIDGRSDRGVICVNHEFTTENMLFPIGTSLPTFLDFPGGGGPALEDFYNSLTEAQQQEGVGVSINAHGVTVAEIAQGLDGAWSLIQDSPYNRRLTGQTPFAFSGPLKGSDLLKARMGPETGQVGQDGTMVLGTLNNCAGGQTPYGTYLSCEENFDQYFGFQSLGEDMVAAEGNDKLVRAMRSVSAFGGNTDPSDRRWEVFGSPLEKRFDLREEPAEIVRFGYVVEVDPFDPNDVPTKRTALGRFKHEGAATALARDNRLAVYSGDDARFEFVYKFVTEDRITPSTTKADNVLDRGTLYAARFDADGTGEWLALVPGQNGLSAANGFGTLEDILTATREAATIAGATPMDRPEDIEPNDGRVYIALTSNGRRTEEGVDAANPRLENNFGHVIEINEFGFDHGATAFTWEIFILCGDPLNTRFIRSRGRMISQSIRVGKDLIDGLADETTYFGGFKDATAITPVNAPDNLTTDALGNLWIVTDGNDFGNDGAFAVPTGGRYRGRVQQFMSGPIDCEVCGAEFTPDNATFFVNIQHPGNTQVEDPSSAWPDADRPDADSFRDAKGNIQPRDALVAIRRLDGGRVGS